MARRRTPLDRDRVLSAALALVDEDGLQALSMRALGARLGVQAMSLYEHVADKEGVLDGIVELLVQEIELPDSETVGWADFLRGSARSYRAVAQRHPSAFVLMLTRPLATEAALARFEAALAAIRRSGFSPEAAVVAFTTLEAFTSGMAMNEVSGATVLDLAGLDQTALPHVAELAAVATGAGPDAIFEAGLAAVIAGIGGLRAEAGSTRRGRVGPPGAKRSRSR